MRMDAKENARSKRPHVGQGWAKDIEPIPGQDGMFCHMQDEEEYDEDHPDWEYELERAEYWAGCFDDMFSDSMESLENLEL